MTRIAKRLLGRTIVAVQPCPFEALWGPGRKTRSRKKAYDPRLFLDDGTVVYFTVQETETGEYGIDICVSSRSKSPRSKKARK